MRREHEAVRGTETLMGQPLGVGGHAVNKAAFWSMFCWVLQVWQTPALAKSMSPMQLHRTYGTCHDDITCLDWSADSQWLLVGSKDLTARRAAQ